MLLAGILLKMGGYALMRFNAEMLPEAHAQLRRCWWCSVW